MIIADSSKIYIHYCNHNNCDPDYEKIFKYNQKSNMKLWIPISTLFIAIVAFVAAILIKKHKKDETIDQSLESHETLTKSIKSSLSV